MRAIAATVAISIAVTVSACERSTLAEAKSVDVEVGKIEATTRERSDNTVAVHLRWSFRRSPSVLLPVTDLPPVTLSNGSTVIRAVPDGELPEWNNDEVHFEATVRVTNDQWTRGCWQAHHQLNHAVGSGPIICLNLIQ